MAVTYYERDGYYAKNDPEHRQASFWYGDAATRRRPQVKAEGMVVAGFRHLASRDQDPQLHTHCVLMKWRSPFTSVVMGPNSGADAWWVRWVRPNHWEAERPDPAGSGVSLRCRESGVGLESGKVSVDRMISN